MFSGLIEEVGTVTGITPSGDAVELRIQADTVLRDLRAGDSIAVDGVCQTVTHVDGSSFVVHAMAPTLGRTTFGHLNPGREVNLERALALGDRIGGHLVQGHVDAVGTVAAITTGHGHVLLDVDVPDPIREATVLHGSIAIDGVSLTVNALAANRVQVALIPHTWQHTNLRRLTPGDAVNLEADLIGKYVAARLREQAGA